MAAWMVNPTTAMGFLLVLAVFMVLVGLVLDANDRKRATPSPATRPLTPGEVARVRERLHRYTLYHTRSGSIRVTPSWVRSGTAGAVVIGRGNKLAVIPIDAALAAHESLAPDIARALAHNDHDDYVG